MLGSCCKHGLENASTVRCSPRLAPGLALSSSKVPLTQQQHQLQHQCASFGNLARSSRCAPGVPLPSRLVCHTAQKEELDSAPAVPPQLHNRQQEQQEHQLRGVGSRSVHDGERGGRPAYHDTLTTPIAQTSTYFFNSTQQVIDFNEGRRESHEYGRYGNPTVKAVQEKLRALEGAEDCLVSASGMSSVTSMLLSLVPAGGHIVTTSDCYWRTRQFMQQFLPKMNIGVSVIAPDDLSALEEALERNPVSLYFSESPTNPYLRCIDIKRVCELCHAKVGAGEQGLARQAG